MEPETAELSDDLFGDFDEQPSAEILMTFEEYNEVADDVLGFKFGPPIAWEYADGILYLWGEKLDEDMLAEAATYCSEVKEEHIAYEFPELARAADRVASKFTSAEVGEQ